jgi:non-homologous end joining protein Ku
VERTDLVRGFELSKDNYVQLTEEELDSLEKRTTQSNFANLCRPKN